MPGSLLKPVCISFKFTLKLAQLEWIASHLYISITLRGPLVFNARLPSVAFDNSVGAILVDGEIHAGDFHARARDLRNLIFVLTIQRGVTAKTKRRDNNLKASLAQS